MDEKIVWIEGRCPICGRIYSYVEGKYHPKTCANFSCVQKYCHNPKYYQMLKEKQLKI